MNQSHKIKIVGGGLVGSLLSIMLKKKGYSVEVFEKREDLRKLEGPQGRSINLVITSRGRVALDQVGLLELAQKQSVPIYGRQIHLNSGSQYLPYGMSDECNWSISRLRLNQFLIDHAIHLGVPFHFMSDLKDIPRDGIVFGCDGAGSMIRKNLITQYPQIFSDKVRWLEVDYKELSLPSYESRGLNKNALHIWPKQTHMLMALANLDGSFTGTVYLPKTGNFGFENLKTESEIKNFFENEFYGSMPYLPNLVDEFKQNPQGSLGTVVCSRWTLWRDDVKVCLLGDAAHAVVPFFGQGMNSGFEDCTELMKFLDQRRGDWQSAFFDFDHLHRDNGYAIGELAEDNWTEMSVRVADPKFLLRKKVESLIEERFPQQYKSRYGLVTFTQTPYRKAQQIGEIQERFFQELCKRIDSPEQVNWEEVRAWLNVLDLPSRVSF